MSYRRLMNSLNRKYLFAGVVVCGLFMVVFISLIQDTPVNAEAAPVTYSQFSQYRNDNYVYVITPTYARPVQKAELTRLSYVLRLSHHIHWIVVEDAANPTKLVTNFLKNSGLSYTQIAQETPASWKIKKTEANWSKPRGVLQRNAALNWVRQSLAGYDKGVLYFADDDNTYSLELFDEIRKVKKVGVWPVGLVGGLLVEKPIVDHGKVVGFNAYWRPDRKFPIDMAGFGVSVKHFLSVPVAKFSLTSQGGFQESDFLKLLIKREELEPLADNCSKVLVWHTRTEKPILVNEDKLKRQGHVPSNSGIEV